MAADRKLRLLGMAGRARAARVPSHVTGDESGTSRACRDGLARSIILGTGHYLPPHRLSNDALIARYQLDATDEWIVAKTGIRERRLAGADETTSALGLHAARRALADAGISPEELNGLLVATSSPDMIQPPTACVIQGALGASRAFACDLGAVCSGFVYALIFGASLLNSDPALNYVLVIGAETYSRLLDYSDRNTCVFFGDGAGAAVLGRGCARGVLSYTLGADGTRASVMGVPAGGAAFPAHAATVAYGRHYFHMAGRDVQDFVTDRLPALVRELASLASLAIGDIDLFIPHQANRALLERAFAVAGVPLERVFFNMEKYGNTAGASLPIALSEAKEMGRLSAGDRVMLLAFGGGLSWGGILVEWADGNARRR